jgi:hypothetical protein
MSNDNQDLIQIVNKKYEKKISSISKTTAITNDNNNNEKIKRHISFKDDFLTIIDVESWKDLNFDVSEIDPEWKKVESSNNNNLNVIEKKNINKNKDKKISCDCVVF